MKILFFLESLHSGGKERRAVELFHYLKQNTDYDFQIVLTEEEIHYKYILNLGVPIKILKRGLLKKDPFMFFKFFNIVRIFKPDIIHSWGAMTTLYAIPSAKIFKIPLINGQIADSIPIKTRSIFFKFIWLINHNLSDVIFSNSNAGLKAYRVKDKKGVVIFNGIRLERFLGLDEKDSVRENFKIKTPYAIIMIANFGKYKDHDLFFKVAERVSNLRNDVTFIAVGEGETRVNYIQKVKNEKNERVLFTGKISNVEELVNVCDIGVLFSNILIGEGISNAIIEYMALSKPVIATDAGGTRELVVNDVSGFLVRRDIDLIVRKINNLLDDSNLRKRMGKKGRELVENSFTIDKMGITFVNEYNKL